MFAARYAAASFLRTSKSLATKSSWRAQAVRPMTLMSKESKEEFKKENYTSKMKSSGNPVSPHVLIYAFPIAAISSITNRVTGAALSVGCAGLGFLELVGGTGTSYWVMETIGSQGFLIASGAKFGVSFTIIYHFLGALRHFAWDYYPDLLTNEEVEKASLALMGGSTVLSGMTMFF